jgi:hypothetical protein
MSKVGTRKSEIPNVKKNLCPLLTSPAGNTSGVNHFERVCVSFYDAVTPQYIATIDTTRIALGAFSQAVSSVATVRFDLTHTDAILVSVRLPKLSRWPPLLHSFKWYDVGSWIGF